MAKAKRQEPLDQYQTMDLLCRDWIGQEGVHGFDCLGESITCYILEKNERVEKKVQAQAGEHKVIFRYGPPERAEDLMRGTRRE